MSDVAVEDFLEHFGIKGMHWGQRKATSSTKKPLTGPERKVRQDKIAVATLVGIGSAYTMAGLAIHMDANPQRYAKAATFTGKMARSSMSVVSKATKGSKLLFQKDGVVFSPGTFSPGMFRNAGPLAITRTASAIRRF